MPNLKRNDANNNNSKSKLNPISINSTSLIVTKINNNNSKQEDEEEEYEENDNEEDCNNDCHDYDNEQFEEEEENEDDNKNIINEVESNSEDDSNSSSTEDYKLKNSNKTFTLDELRDIERNNSILMNKILMENRKHSQYKTYIYRTNKISSAEINRKRVQKRIDHENQILLKKIQTVKPSVKHNMNSR